MSQSEIETPPTVESISAASEGGQVEAPHEPDTRVQPAPKETERHYFLVAETSEGPSAPIDPFVATRRAKRAMERLLSEHSAATAE